jgi:hypothetical protein
VQGGVYEIGIGANNPYPPFHRQPHPSPRKEFGHKRNKVGGHDDVYRHLSGKVKYMLSNGLSVKRITVLRDAEINSA